MAAAAREQAEQLVGRARERGGAAMAVGAPEALRRTGGAGAGPVLARLAIRHIAVGDMAVMPLVDNRGAGRPGLGGKRPVLTDVALPHVPSSQGSLAQSLGVAAPC